MEQIIEGTVGGQRFILGYNADDDIFLPDDHEKLREYTSVEEAEYESEEWCFVFGRDIHHAKERYEETFEKYKNLNLIHGPF